MRISDWSSDVCSSDLVVACGDPTEVFDTAEGIFDEVPATVAVLIVSDGSLAVAAIRNDGAGAILAQGRPQPVCVVALVDEQVAHRSGAFEQCRCSLHIADIASRQDRKSTRLNSSH